MRRETFMELHHRKSTSTILLDGTFKRFCNKSSNYDLWQARSYDHIVRNEQDYQRIRQYIDTNPAKWQEDRFYIDRFANTSRFSHWDVFFDTQTRLYMLQ